MASAFKCDRCGCLYSERDKSIKFRTDSNTYISNLWIGNTESWDSGPKDLCPDCARDFLVWWEHPDLSVTQQLDQITLENIRKLKKTNVVDT